MANSKLPLIVFRVTPEDLGHVDACAARLGVTRSDVVRMALRGQLVAIPIINRGASLRAVPERAFSEPQTQ